MKLGTKIGKRTLPVCESISVFSSNCNRFGGKIKLERRRNNVCITCDQFDMISRDLSLYFFGGKIKMERKVCK